ncbi:MAG: ATP synthase subunit I [Candidatus Binataceae bacterium]
MSVGVTIVLFAILGFGAGAIHFAMLRRNVSLLVSGGSIAATVAATLGRVAITVLIFVVVAMSHGLAVLWTLGGFMLARATAVRFVKAGA